MLTIFAALLLAQAEAPQTLSAANSVAAAGLSSATAAVDAPEEQEICRTRFRRSGGGTNLINGNKSYKVCRTKAEWEAKGGKVD